METFLRILGDGLTITALSIICAASRMAWKRIPAEVTVPMLKSADGRPTWRARRGLALSILPVVASLILLGITFFGLTYAAPDSNAAIILFGIRALLASGFALIHLLHLRWAMQILIEDGEVR
jgi:hypothetical protein